MPPKFQNITILGYLLMYLTYTIFFTSHSHKNFPEVN